MTKKHFFVLLAIGTITVSLFGLAPKALANSNVRVGIDSFTVSHNRVYIGSTIIIDWKTTGLNNCRLAKSIAGTSVGLKIIGARCSEAGEGDIVPPNGSCTIGPLSQLGRISFSIGCRKMGGSPTENRSGGVAVYVIPLPHSSQPIAPPFTPPFIPPSTITPPPQPVGQIVVTPSLNPLYPRLPVTTSILPAVINPPGCIVSPKPLVIANLGVTRACPLPSHSAGGNDPTSINIAWRGEVDTLEADNICVGIIGEGRPWRDRLSCRNATNNWNLNSAPGDWRISGVVGPISLTGTQFGVACTKEVFTCVNYRYFTHRNTHNDMRDCNSRCDYLREGNFRNNIYNCECSEITLPSRGARLTVSSRPVCSPSHSALYPVEAIRDIGAIQEPRVDNNILRTDPPRPQILLNQLVNLTWNANLPGSDTPETMRCTPSIAPGGDGEGWTTGAGIPANLLDSLPSSGRKNNLSPNVTTTYQLSCRNTGAADSNCLSFTANREVRVFTPDIREVPSFYDGFMRVVGIITNNLR